MLRCHQGDTVNLFVRAPSPVHSRTHASLPFRLQRRCSLVLSLLCAEAAWLPCAIAAPPLPQNGTFVAGSGSIARSGANLSIAQSSANGIIDWSSFSIGAGRTVSFDNGSGATLNRVTGNELSVLNGKLTGTGSVYLINPQGVLVGPNGVVTTGGRFVASTLDVDNSAFIAGTPFTLNGTSNGVVVNLGKISSSGSDVFLVANKAVANLGTIKAPNGTTELATGTAVLLQDSSSGQQVFVQAGSGGQTLNAGTVRAAQISLQSMDGNVYALAGRHSVLRATGTATRDGHIWLVADGGTVNAQDAKIKATNADGSGGTVDTSGNALDVDGAKVDAAQWNLSAPVFTISATTADTLGRNLSHGTSVSVNTTGANGTTGDIDVQGDISWNGAASLALNAFHSISLAPTTTIANRGSGDLTLRADATAIDNGGSVTNNGTIDWSKSTGIVSALYDMNGTYTPGTIKSNSAWSAAPFSGLLTQVTAYELVNSLADLNNVSLNLAGIYALGTNVVGDPSVIFESIGASNNLPFTGQFDGMRHTISNLDLADANYAATNGVGLFSVIGTTGVVRNLGVINSNAPLGQEAIIAPIGVIAGDNFGLITYSYTAGGTIGAEPYGGLSGGLVGQNDGTIERSSSNMTVDGFGREGGLVGVNNGVIVQSYATGSVTGDIHSSAGGLVGVNHATGVINQSYATGSVDDPSLGAIGGGGLVDANAGLIEESFDAASMIVPTLGPPGSYEFGGVAANNTGTIANNVFWNTQTTTLTTGVAFGTAVPAANGLTTAQMSTPASFGPTWNFGPNGTWLIPAGGTNPILQWQTTTQLQAQPL
jgi:filamentous hemagglutinin family protein